MDKTLTAIPCVPDLVTGRIAVIKLSSLGDLFHVLPVVHLLKTNWGVTIDWITQKEYCPLAACFQDVDRVIGFPRRGTLPGMSSFWAELREQRYDWIIDFQGLLKSALVGICARSRRRLGPSFHREGAHWLYSAVAGTRNKARHAVDENLDVARFFGLPATPLEFPVRFPPLAVSEPRPRVGLMPVSRWVTKNWMPDSYGEVCRILRQRSGASVFLFGGKDAAEMAICEKISHWAGAQVQNMAGRTSLVAMGSWLQTMDLVITNDSGPMHMAAALGVPVLALFGPTDANRTGPFGPDHRVLTADADCRPCFNRRCRKEQVVCMQGIAPTTVIDTALEILGKKCY